MVHRSRLIAVLALLGLSLAGAASAQQTNVLSFTGTSTAAGVVKRTIIDITKPSIGPDGAGKQGARFFCGPTSFVILVPIPTGRTQAQIGLAYRDSANAVSARVDPCGAYSSYFAAADSHKVALQKPLGTFSISDSIVIPGVSVSSSNVGPGGGGPAVGPASSSGGIAALVLLMAGAGVIILRRREQD